MAWTERDGVRLHTERAGSGRPLLFISGTGGDLRIRPNIFDSPVGIQFDLVAYDQRGLGQSDQPPGPYSMADYADDAAAVIEGAGWSSAAVLGVSFGGMVAQELLLRHPNRVDRAVLACTSSGGAGGASYPLHELSELEPSERTGRSLPLMDTRWADPVFDDPARQFLSTALAAAGPPDRGAQLQLEARRHHDTFDRLGAVRCPVLVCGGRYDGIAPEANVAALAKAIPGAGLRLFEGGHVLIHQDPAAYPEMIAFLEG